MFKGFFIKTIVKWLAKLDGQEGFSFQDVVEFVRLADQLTEVTGLDKANWVIKKIVEFFGGNEAWILQTIAQLAYVYARMKGVIKR